MNRWKGSKSWILVGGISLLVGMLFYSGFKSSLFESSQVREQTKEKAQIVSLQVPAPVSGNAGDGGAAHNSLNKDQEIRGEQNLVLEKADPGEKSLTIKDFPSPVQGNILRGVGNYYSEVIDNFIFHTGIDYAEPEGTIIRASHGGKVIFAGRDLILGQKVILDCGKGWLVTYGGLDNLRVQAGETVEAQEALAQVGFYPGTEGESDQPQLHYEVWHGNGMQRPEPKY